MPQVDTNICPGKILKLACEECMILHIDRDSIYTCLRNTTKLSVKVFDRKEIVKLIVNEQASLENPKESPVINLDDLSDKEKENFQIKKEIITALESFYGPSFEEFSRKTPKPLIGNLLTKYHIGKATLYRHLTKYLQSGRDIYSLVRKPREKADKEKARTGYAYHKSQDADNNGQMYVLTGNDFQNFQWALKAFLNKKVTSIKKAYTLMLGTFYYEELQNFNSDISASFPSERQFRYFVSKNLTKEEAQTIRTNARRVRNDQRLLPSNSLDGVHGPGDLCEVDAVEVDVELVSDHDPNQIIGRPTLYAMIDVFSKIILAFGIGFNVNSMLGITNMLLNLIEDKVQFCQNFGFQISEEMWPSGFLPARFRVDRGSEAISDKLKEVLNRLGIQRDVVPGGTGSLKGNVEQLFHQMHTSQNSSLTNNGRIEKTYESNHKATAKLTLSEYMSIILNFIIQHNQKYMENYPITMEMRKESVPPIPSELWKYGCLTYGLPKKITDKNQFLFDLLPSAEGAYISRRGVIFKGLKYSVASDPALKQQAFDAANHHIPIEMRYDPRLVDVLYYLDDNRNLRTIHLSDEPGMNDLEGMTFSEWESWRETKKKQDKAGRIRNLQLDAKTSLLNNEVVDSVKERKKTKNKKKNIREARDEAKQEVNREGNIQKLVDLPSIPAKKKTNEPMSATNENISDPNSNLKQQWSSDVDEEELERLLDELS